MTKAKNPHSRGQHSHTQRSLEQDALDSQSLDSQALEQGSPEQHSHARHQLDRRTFLKGAGITAAGVAALSGIAGCGYKNYTPYAEGSVGAQGNGSTTISDTPSFMQKPEAITKFEETLNCDVLVIGAGAAGVPAALSAAENGANVVLLQKENIAMSHGNSAAGLNIEKCDKAAVEHLISMVVKANQHRSHRKLVENWAYNSGEALHWCIDRVQSVGGPALDDGNTQQKATLNINGFKLDYVTAFFGPKPYTTGDAMQSLAEVATAKGVNIRYSTPAKQLHKDKNGNVDGAIAQREDGKYILVNAKSGVILATGDYSNDEEMCDYYIPDIHNFERKQTNQTGDGHKMGLWAGASMEKIGHTKMLHDFDAGPASMCDMPFLAVCDNTGKRFMDETVDMSLTNNYLRDGQHPGWYSQVFDANYMTDAASWKGKLVDPEGLRTYMPEENVERKGVFADQVRTFKANTLEELATKIGQDPATFKKTVDEYNALCDAGADTEFGKDPQYLKPVRQAPFYAIHRRMRLSTICSGLEVNENNQALTPDGNVIEGLYIIGNCAGNFYGGVDYPLDIYGLSLGRNITAGYVTGKYLATK